MPIESAHSDSLSDWYLAGTELSADAVRDFERRVSSNPGNIEARIKILGYYFRLRKSEESAIRRFSIVLAGTILSGCAALEPRDARPGLDGLEIHALEETYYWQPKFGVPKYTDSELSRLLAGTANNTQDAERGEEHASDIAVALASVGDDRFSAVLSEQTEADRKAVSQLISYLWTHYGLKYPKTEKLLGQYH